MSEPGEGTIDIRKTHPNLYWLVMTLALVGLALGLNFIFLHPTFPIYGASNYLWGGIFLGIAFGKIISLNLYRRLRLVRGIMAFAVAYMMFLALGTMQPYLEGVGSLQLPILYAGMSALQIPLLLEPFINPRTAKR